MRDLSKFYFPGREPDETIMMAIRRHPVVIGKRITAFVISLFIPVVIGIVLNSLTTWLDDPTSLFPAIVVLVASLYYLMVCLAMYHTWVNYYLDLWVVTNERVVSIDQRGIFDRKVSALQLDRIQDVTSEVRGFVASMFKYGTVELQTAGKDEHFVFTQVPNAEKVASQILEMHEQYIAARQQTAGPIAAPPPDGSGGI